MDKRSKGKMKAQMAVPPVGVVDRGDVLQTVHRLLNLLNEEQIDTGDAVLSLLLAFMQTSVQVLEEGTAEDLEANRDVLLSMLEHARQVLLDPAAAVAATVH